MSGYLVDTNVISEIARPIPDRNVVTWLGEADPADLYISVVTLGEIRLGIENLGQGVRRSNLEQWLAHDLADWFGRNTLSVTPPIADRWARITAQAKSGGHVVDMADGLIAATAVEHELTLVTRNIKDFVPLGVALFNPW